MRRIIASVALLLAVLLVAGCGTEVPDAKGMTVEQATRAIVAAGFKLGAVTYDEGAQGAVGAVIGQDPAGGARAKDGSAIALTVAGPAPVATPNVVGLGTSEASAALAAVGLTLGTVSENYDASAAAGTVISQVPAAGTATPKGSPVALIVSKGVKPVAVPNVKGKTQAAATDALMDVGFKVKVLTAHSSVTKGNVISQSPSAGMVQPGSTVTITVSTGVELVKVPKVIGMYPDDAAKVLRAAGLRVKNVSIHGPIEPDAGNADIGEVYRQTPKAGSMVPKGTVITIRSWWEMG
jgi:serine/threonine-protein kinase